MKKIDYKLLIISLIIPFITALIGNIFTSSNINDWYSTINKPTFNPPNFVFGPVWTILYLLMGISLYLIWNTKTKEDKIKNLALTFFAIQLILNALWSILFFGFHNIQLAFIEIILLWISIITMIFYFHKINKTSAYLQIPYFLWVSFATFLNYNILILN